MRFDIFCDIVDNYGDAGVCWRLARRLAQTSSSHNQDSIRLFCNDLNLLNHLAGGNATALGKDLQIEILTWDEACEQTEMPEVVIEAFGCNLPEAYLKKVKQHSQNIIINLEYLSAEDWIDSHHGLGSQSDGLKKYFYFPGFSEASGGLLKGTLPEKTTPTPPSLTQAWKNLLPNSLNISLFCYEAPEVVNFLNQLISVNQSINLVVCHGQAQTTVAKWIGQELATGKAVSCKNLQIIPLPFVSQDDFDWVLTQCDINIVRGEDSFVRAQWAGNPFIWQIYPQSDDAHVIKLDAFLEKYLNGAHSEALKAANALMHWQSPTLWLNDLKSLKIHAQSWKNRLTELHQDGDLAEKLRNFIKTH